MVPLTETVLNSWISRIVHYSFLSRTCTFHIRNPLVLLSRKSTVTHKRRHTHTNIFVLVDITSIIKINALCLILKLVASNLFLICLTFRSSVFFFGSFFYELKVRILRQCEATIIVERKNVSCGFCDVVCFNQMQFSILFN